MAAGGESGGGERRAEEAEGMLGELGLEDLKARLDELQRTVEELGRVGGLPAAPSPAHPPQPRPTSPPAPARTAVEAAAPTGRVVLEAGPFAGLSQLHRYERDLGRLESVVEARVRRFGHGRAEIELAASDPARLAGELARLGGRVRERAGGEPGLAVELLTPEEER